MTINGNLFAFFRPIKCNMSRNPICSGRNETLRPRLNCNRGIVTISKLSQIWFLTTRIVRNGCLGVFGPETEEKQYYFE